jgi:hypothetical protein
VSIPVEEHQKPGIPGLGDTGRVRVAIDLDNTLTCYDGVFAEAAQASGLVGPDFRGGKRVVRELVRQLPEGERLWQQIQGEVYGKRIAGAELYEGAEDFLRRCQREGAHFWIVSHKTQFNYFDPDRVDLRKAALGWLEAKRLFDVADLGLSPNLVFFEPTRPDKIARLVSLGCTHVVDDLVEVFREPAFPVEARKLLFDPSMSTGTSSWASWQEIEQEIFGPRQSTRAKSSNADCEPR